MRMVMRRRNRSAIRSVAATAVELMTLRRLRTPTVERMRSMRRMITTEMVNGVMFLLAVDGEVLDSLRMDLLMAVVEKLESGLR